MADQEYITLAYSKSPKVSRRTTFQDELQAKVTARASRAKADRYDAFSDDIEDEENDFFSQLGSRRARASAFKTGRSRARVNDFDLSDEDESKRGATKKRVSFLRTQRGSSPVATAAPEGAPDGVPPDPAAGGGASDPTTSTSSRDDSADRSGTGHASLRSTSLSCQTSGDGSQEPKSPLTPTSDQAASPTPAPGGRREEGPSAEGRETQNSRPPQPRGSTEDSAWTEGAADRPTPRPRPRPRQRPHSAGPPAAEVVAAAPQSSPSPHSTSAGSLTTPSPAAAVGGVPAEGRSPQGSEGEGRTLPVSQSSSFPRSEQFSSLTRTTVDSTSLDHLSSEDSKEHERRYSTSFEEYQRELEEQLDPDRDGPSNGNIADSRSPSGLLRSAGGSRSACWSRVESRYLGTLKLLEHSSPPGQTQLDAGDALRVAVYQEWLRKKQETLKDREQKRKKEDSLKEEKLKTDQADQREHALASFQAWKEKKSETLKAKATEQEASSREQRRAAEEREEKKQMAAEVFEKWKKGHDELLREKYRKLKERENKLKQNKLEKEEERKTDSKYAISDWNERKKNVICDKVTAESKRSRTKAQQERMQREEKDKMALEMYEKWLTRKERDLRRQREERKIRAILQDSPPLPWSPPNKTIPFRK